MPTFELGIRLGDLMQIIMLAAGGLIVLGQMKSDSKSSDKRLAQLEEGMAKQTDILSRLASGEQRMNGLDHRVQLLERRVK